MVSPPMMQGTDAREPLPMRVIIASQRGQFHPAEHGRREQRRAGRRLEERHVDPRGPLDLLGEGHLPLHQVHGNAAATASGSAATSHSRFSKPTRLLAMENGPLTGIRTWVSDIATSRVATRITMGIRPSLRGFSGGSPINSAADL